MVLTLLISISFLLIFSALCRQTPYEKHLSDIQQEHFIKEYKHRKKSHL